MKLGFYKEFKEYLLINQAENIEKLAPYFETLKQNEANIHEILHDYNMYYMDIEYIELNNENNNALGKFVIYFYRRPLEDDHYYESRLNHTYEIELLEYKRFWAYCECQPHYKGYNKKYKCCGKVCDWVAPLINIKKISEVLYKPYEGNASELWRLEEEWGKIVRKDTVND